MPVHWIKLEKLYYDTNPPADVQIKQVIHVMQKVADSKGCVVEFLCRGERRKVIPKSKK